MHRCNRTASFAQGAPRGPLLFLGREGPDRRAESRSCRAVRSSPFEVSWRAQVERIFAFCAANSSSVRGPLVFQLRELPNLLPPTRSPGREECPSSSGLCEDSGCLCKAPLRLGVAAWVG